MKKRLIAVMFAAIMAIGCVFGLAACKDDTNNNVPPTTISGEWDCWELRKNSDTQKWWGNIEFSVTFSNGSATYDGETLPYTIENGKLKFEEFEMEWKNGQWEISRVSDETVKAYVLVEKGKTLVGYELEDRI